MGHLDAAVAVGGQGEQAVVRAHEEAVAAAAQSDRPPGPAHPGVDHREVHGPVGQVRQRVAQHEGPGQHVALRQPVRDVDHAHIGSDARDHAAAHAGEVVGVAVVTREAERSAHSGNLRRCAARRNVSWLDPALLVARRMGIDTAPKQPP